MSTFRSRVGPALVNVTVAVPSVHVGSQLVEPVARRLTLHLPLSRFAAQPDPISAQRPQDHQGDGRRAEDLRRHQAPEPGALLRSGAPQGKSRTFFHTLPLRR